MAAQSKELGKVTERAGKNASRKELLTLVENQEFRCALTGVVLSPNEAALDHIQPVSLGGDHSIENLQVVHDVINTMKGAMTNGDFITWCKRVAAWNG